jgi:hypothetical protein
MIGTKPVLSWPRKRILAVVAGVVVLLMVFVAAIVVTRANAGPVVTFTARGPSASSTSPIPTAARPSAETTPAPPLYTLHGANAVTGPSSWWSWSLVDRRTGESWGGPTADEPTRSVSMIKFWLGGLYLREHPQPSQGMVNQLSTMIRDSNNDVANDIFFGLGGRLPVVAAMETVCGVKGPYILPGWWWASTWISSRDAARLGACLAGGRVANSQWTEWLLGEMRQVRGGGNFGIRFAFPEPIRSTIAIKNGWNIEEGVWYVNCLAIGDTWVLVTESRAGSFITGRDVCVGVTEQLLREPIASPEPQVTHSPLA